MPQSRLIDVNTAAIKYRNAIDQGLDSQNYNKVFGSCYAINALLPNGPEDDGRQKYRITISDVLYKKFTHYDRMITCTECSEQSIFDKVKMFDLLPPMMIKGMTTAKNERVWVCPKCNEECNLLKSDMTEKTLKEPYFIRVVPKIPKRSEGILDRAEYHQAVVRWVTMFRVEWEASMAQFRDDNWQKKGTMFDDEVADGGEGED